MIFEQTRLAGVILVKPELREDERGFFARTFCESEFAREGLVNRFVQSSISYNKRRGTLRGMHWQLAPRCETKLVRCTAGAIYDVALDIRTDSPTFGRWEAFELSASNRAALYIPPGFAHGFQTLTDGAEVFYQISEPYEPSLAAGVRWNDPRFAICWPLADPILSERDRAFPDFGG